MDKQMVEWSDKCTDEWMGGGCMDWRMNGYIGVMDTQMSR